MSESFRSEKQFEPRPSLSTDHLVLLVDPRLAHLPLEALDIFKHVQIGGISRDFSLQSVYNRLNANIGLDEGAAPPDGELKGIRRLASTLSHRRPCQCSGKGS